MPSIDVVVSCPIHDSFRVQQVAGMFDVPLAERATERFEVDVPGIDEEWQIGLIVGPSGSGKSTIAGHAFKANVYTNAQWRSDRAVVDCFGELSVRHVVDLFTAVGFGSPPSWVKPYHVLSNGERFRCDLEPIPIPRRRSRRRRRIVDERRPDSLSLSFPSVSASGERGWSNCVRARRPNGGRAGLGGVAGTAGRAAGSGVGIRDSWQVAAPVRPRTLCPGKDVARGVREKKDVGPEFRPRSQRAASGRACSRPRWRHRSARPGNRSAPIA